MHSHRPRKNKNGKKLVQSDYRRIPQDTAGSLNTIFLTILVGENPNTYDMVHKKGLQRLAPNPDYSCARCMGNARPIDGRPQNEVQVGPDKLEVVASFCYLGDMLSAGGGCEIAVTTRVLLRAERHAPCQ